MHVGCRDAVIVIKEAHAQVHELKSYVCRLLLVQNNGYSIHGIDSGQNTLLNIICRLCSLIFIGHVCFLCIIVICKRCNCGLILHKSKRMWNNIGALRTQEFSSATHNEKCVTVTQKKWRIFWPKFHTKFCVIYTWQFLQCKPSGIEFHSRIECGRHKW